MSEMNPIEREQKKKQLRGRVIDTATQDMFPRRGISHGENEEEVAEKAERHSRRKRLRRVLTAVLIAALLRLVLCIIKITMPTRTIRWRGKKRLRRVRAARRNLYRLGIMY